MSGPITADEAISLLPDGEFVHTTTVGPMMFGADWSRQDAIETILGASKLNILDGFARGMGHTLEVWDRPDHRYLFQVDAQKLKTFEAAT